jgi:uncharacterized tellurite resistance protein B-like protein
MKRTGARERRIALARKLRKMIKSTGDLEEMGAAIHFLLDWFVDVESRAAVRARRAKRGGRGNPDATT